MAKELFHPFKAELNPGPQAYTLEHIDIEINHRCNLSCRHCSATAGKGIYSDELSSAEIKKILSEAREMGLRQVGLTGGEPLYDMEKLDAVGYFCAEELQVRLHTHTNGTLIRDRMRKDGKALSLFESISVTFLGGNVADHDDMTSIKGSFEETLAGAKLLAARDFPLTCYFVPTSNMCSQFPRLTHQLHNIGARRIRAMALAPGGRARPIYSRLVSSQTEMEKFEHSLLEKKDSLDIRLEAGYCTRIGMRKLSVLNGHETCTSGVNRVHINSKGDVFPCTAASGVKELRLGNIRDRGFRLSEMWLNSELVRRIRLVHDGLLKQCTDCSHQPKCQFGCIVNACGTMPRDKQTECPLMNLTLEV
jgi:radical SAM protein with 4Fe4S-binding SPASM domain